LRSAFLLVLPSFPTRRSSDLSQGAVLAIVESTVVGTGRQEQTEAGNYCQEFQTTVHGRLLRRYGFTILTDACSGVARFTGDRTNQRRSMSGSGSREAQFYHKLSASEALAALPPFSLGMAGGIRDKKSHGAAVCGNKGSGSQGEGPYPSSRLAGVTRITSAMVVRPAATFWAPLRRRVFMPSLMAWSRSWSMSQWLSIRFRRPLDRGMISYTPARPR